MLTTPHTAVPAPLLVVIGLGLLVFGCGPGAGRWPADVVPAVNPCLVEPDRVPAQDTVAVALPAGPAERFLAAHVAEFAAPPDCAGRSTAALTGAFRMASAEPLLPVLVPAPERSGPTIRLRVASPEADARDLIDGGADVVVTDDPRALDYAGRRGDLRVVPLAWATTYALALPPGTAFPLELSPDFRADLARDAVKVEARLAEPHGWWYGAEACRSGPATAANRLAGIGIPAGDATARALADRLVALAAPAGPTRVLAFAEPGFDAVLAEGGLMAFVIRLPRQPPPDCRDIHRPAAGWTLHPLVDIRAHAVVRSAVPPFLILSNGSILFLSGDNR